MVLSGFRPMAFVSMSGERSGFPGSARTRFTSFPAPDMFLNFVFPFICNGKGFSPVKKKDPHVTKRDPEIITVFIS